MYSSDDDDIEVVDACERRPQITTSSNTSPSSPSASASPTLAKEVREVLPPPRAVPETYLDRCAVLMDFTPVYMSSSDFVEVAVCVLPFPLRGKPIAGEGPKTELRWERTLVRKASVQLEGSPSAKKMRLREHKHDCELIHGIPVYLNGCGERTRAIGLTSSNDATFVVGDSIDEVEDWKAVEALFLAVKQQVLRCGLDGIAVLTPAARCGIVQQQLLALQQSESTSLRSSLSAFGVFSFESVVGGGWASWCTQAGTSMAGKCRFHHQAAVNECDRPLRCCLNVVEAMEKTIKQGAQSIHQSC